MARTTNRARGWALQALYAWEMRGGESDTLVRVLHQLAEDLNVAPESRLYADVLVRLVARNLVPIDRTLEQHLTNWSLRRLAVIDRSILRLAVAELMFVDEPDPRIAIREAVALAEKYATPESPRFVNGVLDAVMRTIAAARGGGTAR
jgi:transcription antitermination protein NusB